MLGSMDPTIIVLLVWVALRMVLQECEVWQENSITYWPDVVLQVAVFAWDFELECFVMVHNCLRMGSLLSARIDPGNRETKERLSSSGNVMVNR